jgi:replicative DNA helicase
MSAVDEKGLPCNLDAERFVLGSILLDDAQFIQVAGILEADDFSLEKHRRIFHRMADLNERGERIDRVTLANELQGYGELESCDGLSYLVSLDDGLPRIYRLDSYVRIVKDKAVLRRIILTSQHTMNQCLAGAADSEQILLSAQESLLTLGHQACHREEMRSPAEIIDAGGGIDAFFQPPEPGVLTPWRTLNKITLGLQRGDVVFLGGRPSWGKTTMALEMIAHAAAHNVGTMMFSLEMSPKALLRKLLCMMGQVRLDDFKSGNILADERKRMFDAIGTLSNLRINERPIATVRSIHSAVRRMKARQDIGLVVVDYLQLLNTTAHQQRYVEVGSISRDLKLAARDCDIPFLVLCQLSRACESEKRRPTMNDLRESGNLEQDGDVVLLLYRPAPDSQDGTGRKPGYTELIVAKQRDGAAGLEVPPIKMTFDKHRGKFLEPTNEEEAAGGQYEL